MRELDREGIVQAEPLGQLRTFGGGRLLAHHIGDRIADEAEHRKCDQRHRQYRKERPIPRAPARQAFAAGRPA